MCSIVISQTRSTRSTSDDTLCSTSLRLHHLLLIALMKPDTSFRISSVSWRVSATKCAGRHDSSVTLPAQSRADSSMLQSMFRMSSSLLWRFRYMYARYTALPAIRMMTGNRMEISSVTSIPFGRGWGAGNVGVLSGKQYVMKVFKPQDS